MNEQLQQLEIQLANFTLVKKIGIYVFIFIAIVYASWNFFGEELNTSILTNKDSIISFEQKLKKNNIKSIEQSHKKTEKNILILKDDIISLRFKEQFIINKLESLDFVYFNDAGIAEILDGILKNSLKYDVDINMIKYESKDVVYAAHVKEREQIVILGEASFKNIMQLIQYIDSINALLQIREIDVDISEEDVTKFKLQISHYGVQL